MVSPWLADVNSSRSKMPGVALFAEDRLLVPGKISPGEDRDDFVAPFLDVCVAAFFSVHQHDDESDLAPGFFDCVYGLDGGPACCDDVVNYDYRIARRKIAFDPLLPAVFFRCFPDRENLERTGRILALCGDTDAQRDRIGTQR